MMARSQGSRLNKTVCLVMCQCGLKIIQGVLGVFSHCFVVFPFVLLFFPLFCCFFPLFWEFCPIVLGIFSIVLLFSLMSLRPWRPIVSFEAPLRDLEMAGSKGTQKILYW